MSKTWWKISGMCQQQNKTFFSEDDQKFIFVYNQKILVAVSQEKANSWLMKVSRNPIKLIKKGREMSMVSMLV